MATNAKPISIFYELTEPTDSDLLITVSGGSNYKITKANFLGSANNTTQGFYESLSFGFWNTCSGYYCTAIGNNNISGGEYGSLAIGLSNQASAQFSTACGYHNLASGWTSTAIGGENVAYSNFATAVGGENIASTQGSAIGYANNASYSAVAIGSQNTAASYSVAAGYKNFAYSNSSIAIGQNNVIYQNYSIALGRYNNVIKYNSMAIGNNNTSSGYLSTAIGNNNSVTNKLANTLGTGNTASGFYALAIGVGNTASGYTSLSIGSNNIASGSNSIAIGNQCVAYNNYTVAIGYEAVANIENTVNFGGPIIVRKSYGIASDHEPYAGVQDVLMSEEVDLTQLESIHSEVIGAAYKEINSGSTFYPDEIGLIITALSNLTSQPTIEFGTEVGARISVILVNEDSASGTGTDIGFSFTGSTPGNTLIAVIAADQSGVVFDDPILNGTTTMNVASTANSGNLSLAVFVLQNADSFNSIVFNYSVSANAIGFILEYNGLTLNSTFDSASAAEGLSSSNPESGSTTTSTTLGFPGDLCLAIIANTQTGGFDTPTNGYSIIDQGNFGSCNAAIITNTLTGNRSTGTSVSSPDPADYLGLVSTFHADFAGSDDLTTSLTPSVTMLKKRYVITALNNNDGHSFLWAGVTTAAVAYDSGYLRGRFYWKGILVEDQ